MNALLEQLRGGDRRSIGSVPSVVEQVMAEASLFSVVFEGLSNPDPLVRMRCADAIEKITLAHPEYLGPYKLKLIRLAAEAREQEVRWHMAQLLSRVKLDRRERRRVVEILYGYLDDASRILRTFCMQTLADLAIQDPELSAPIVQRLEELTRTGSPAMKSRGRKLLARLKQPQGVPRRN